MSYFVCFAVRRQRAEWQSEKKEEEREAAKDGVAGEKEAGALTGICTAFKGRLMRTHISKWFAQSAASSGSPRSASEWLAAL